MKVLMEQEILKENENQANENRKTFSNTLVVNMIGSPGCGKTTILERTLEALSDEFRMAVVEGDIYTTKDANRIEKYGIPVIQVNTAGGCHLSAEITAKAASDLDLSQIDILFIENVGNLVCPAEFDLGEDYKAAVLSTTEGEDKPAKYPLLFQKAGVALINKVDLLPYVNFDMDNAVHDIIGLNPEISVLKMTATTADGFNAWYDWLRNALKKKRGQA